MQKLEYVAFGRNRVIRWLYISDNSVFATGRHDRTPQVGTSGSVAAMMGRARRFPASDRPRSGLALSRSSADGRCDEGKWLRGTSKKYLASPPRQCERRAVTIRFIRVGRSRVRQCRTDGLTWSTTGRSSLLQSAEGQAASASLRRPAIIVLKAGRAWQRASQALILGCRSKR